MVISRLGRVVNALSSVPRLPGKRWPSRHSELSAGSRDRRLTLAISRGLASSSKYSSPHMLSEATRTALAAKSDAKPGMDAPSLGPIADDVLIVGVEGIGDANMPFQLIGQAVGKANAGEPIGVETHALAGELIEVGVAPGAGVGNGCPI